MGADGWIKPGLRRLARSAWLRPVHIGEYVRRLHFLRWRRRLPLSRFQRILDAGCGQGKLALEMARRCPWAQVVGYDLAPAPPAADAPKNLSIVQADLLRLTASKEFDFIYSIDVLEHIRGNAEVLRNFHRALKAGGFLFLHMPDDRRPGRILPARVFREFDRWAKDEHVGEQYTPAELRILLEGLGFTVLASRHTFGRLGQLAWELDRLSDRRRRTKLLLMPALKTMAWISVRTRPRRGATLVLAQK